MQAWCRTHYLWDRSYEGLTLNACWQIAQEVMQRGAEEIGKMLNKGFDRQRLPTGGEMPLVLAGDALDVLPGEEKDVDLLSLHQGPLKGQQVSAERGAGATFAARQWMKDGDVDVDANADAEGEMN